MPGCPAPLLLAETTLPSWLVIPMAGVMLIFIARHVLRVQVVELVGMRRRFRIANGILMMFTVTLLAYALGIAPVVVDARAQPAEARAYVLVWTGIVALLTIIVMLAAADALETMRAAARLRRELRGELLGGLGRSRGADVARGPGDGPRG